MYSTDRMNTQSSPSCLLLYGSLNLWFHLCIKDVLSHRRFWIFFQLFLCLNSASYQCYWNICYNNLEAYNMIGHAMTKRRRKKDFPGNFFVLIYVLPATLSFIITRRFLIYFLLDLGRVCCCGVEHPVCRKGRRQEFFHELLNKYLNFF